MESLRWGKPTAFFAVPRVWEKLELALREQLLNKKAYPPAMVKWAQKIGTENVMAMLSKTEKPMIHSLSNILFHKQIKS